MRNIAFGAGARQVPKRMMNYAKANKMKTVMGVAGSMGVASYMMGGRRGRGVDKMRGGRPTGMYRY